MQILDINNFIIDKGYRKEPVINIFGVGGEIKKVYGFKPYFFAQVNENYRNSFIETLTYKNLDFEIHYKYLPMYYQEKKTEVFKIYANDPRDIRTLREEIKSFQGVKAIFEADILFKNRYLIDKNLFGMQYIDENGASFSKDSNEDLKILAFDIEVLPPESLHMPTSDKDKIIIISFAFSHNYEGRKTLVGIVGNGQSSEDVVFCQTEKILLWLFNETINNYNPDILTGYNINGFDFEYINNRMSYNYLKPIIGRNNSQMWIKKMVMSTQVSITGRVIFDLLPLVKANYNYASYNLKTIAHELLKNDKIDMPMSKMREEYISDNYKNSIDYARHDAVLALELLYKTKFLDKYIAISKLTGLLLQDCVNSGQSQKIEMKIMREFLKEDRLMAMKPEYNEEMEADNTVKYGGAKVFDPVIGLSKDVVVLDYKSLYPTIMISQNYSYDTIIREEDKNKYKNYPINKAVVGGWFVKPEIITGVVPRILTELLNQRIEIKKAMKATTGPEKEYLDARQYALKILLNSFYGYAGYTRARLFELGIAAAVTSFGRQNIEETKKFIENNYGYKVIAGDTDSVFIKINDDKYKDGEVPLDQLKKIGVAIGKARSEQLPAPMELLYEKIAKRIIFEAKKKYVYLNYDQNKDGIWENKIKSSGIELIRKDWCPIVGKTLKKCVESVLINNDMETAIKFVREAVEKIENLEYHKPKDLEDITLTKKYTKNINEYKVIPIHIRVAKKMIDNNEQLVIGDRISYLIVCGDGKFNKRAESVEHILKYNLEIDRKYYGETQLLPAIDRFLKVLGIDKSKYYRGISSSKKDKIILKTNGKNVMQKNLFSYE